MYETPSSPSLKTPRPVAGTCAGTRFRMFYAAYFFLVWLAVCNFSNAHTNVVLILADDLGFSDLGCYGGEIETPNLDRLADRGLRFSQFYNTARCWPTRAALLTGYYAQQVRRDALPNNPQAGQGTRPRWAPLLPVLLRKAGYRTYHSGKWHLDGAPLSSGFDRSYRVEDHDRLFAPKNHQEDDRSLPAVNRDSDYYVTTAITNHAITCLKDHAENYAAQPFFQYVAFTAPHFPLQAPQELVDKYRQRYLRGWDVVRAERWDRIRKDGWIKGQLSEVETEVGPPYAFPEAFKQLGPNELNRPQRWTELTDEQRTFQATKMAIHAAMVDSMDHEIGRLCDQLKDMGVWDDTLILFLSDNGASAEIMVRGDGHDRNLPLGSPGTFLCLGPGWSTVSNTPFRRHKTWIHEGGIATPLIAHWPAKITTVGQWRGAVGHVIDLFPTLLETAGLSIDNNAGTSGPPRPGISLFSCWTSDSRPTREQKPLWWYHEGNRGLNDGKWKLVSTGDAAWELYDLSSDRTETRNQAAEHPDRARQMAHVWSENLRQIQADAARSDRVE